MSVGCLLLTMDAMRKMVKLVKVLSSVSVDGISVEVRPGVVDVKFVSVENCVLSEDGYVKFLKIWMRMSK